MNKVLSILIVDDHNLIVEGYKSILQYIPNCDVRITSASNCEIAYKIIHDNKYTQGFDFVILDWILPNDPYHDVNSGGDLALIVKKILPQTKILIVTSHEEAFELYHIVKKIDPSGLLVKSDFDAENLLSAIGVIMGGGVYYTASVKRSIKEVNSRETYLDNFNRQIISLLSKGIKTKNLPQYLPLSLSAIDKRKAQIKDYFLIGRGSDEDIIKEAKKRGLI